METMKIQLAVILRLVQAGPLGNPGRSVQLPVGEDCNVELAIVEMEQPVQARLLKKDHVRVMSAQNGQTGQPGPIVLLHVVEERNLLAVLAKTANKDKEVVSDRLSWCIIVTPFHVRTGKIGVNSQTAVCHAVGERKFRQDSVWEVFRVWIAPVLIKT